MVNEREKTIIHIKAELNSWHTMSDNDVLGEAKWILQ